MVCGPAQVMVGAVASRTVIVWLTVPDMLPQASTAFQVFVRVYVPPQPGVGWSPTSTTIGAGRQLSVAVGGVNIGTAGHSIVALAPAAPIVGGVVSLTVMVWEQSLVLPQSSLAR